MVTDRRGDDHREPAEGRAPTHTGARAHQKWTRTPA